MRPVKSTWNFTQPPCVVRTPLAVGSPLIPYSGQSDSEARAYLVPRPLES
jgi:hypothetical protein